ncbi:hypothetical protein NRB14_22820 [Pseudomonas viridiflava]|uniref:hypothetical protein n=1 Tax=Pseudomonas viridiflava TaxID=33069 RepID=UPI001259896E|nr:hypothetical protein [Pseudomonas viridiflava]MCQ9394443.1 hypothetical protein [Pseudomonas viridiflava]VVN10638.1 hypothetical protein PS634_03797 [Pseudomonas fluorescens]
MKNSVAITELGLVVIVVAFVAAFLWFLFFVIVECVLASWSRAAFRKDVVSSLNNAGLSWEQLCETALRHRLNQKNALHAIRILYTDILVGNKKCNENNSMLPALEGFIADYKNEELFEELPSETRATLASIRKTLGQSANVLDPLLMQVKSIVGKKDKVNARQRFYTCWGFMVGVVGVVFSVYVYVDSLPVSTSQAVTPAASIQTENNNKIQ